MILALAIAVTAWLWLRRPDGSVANIYVDGRLVRSVDLDALTAAETFTVDTGRGENVILAEHGRIRVQSSDCPDQVCVNDGWLTSAAPIVCLPHRLVIEFSHPSDTGVDAEAR